MIVVHFRCEKLELLGDKQVQAEKGSKHGSWDLGEDDELTIVWHFQGDGPLVRRHRYARIPSTEAWQLLELEDDPVDTIAFLFPPARDTTHAPLNFIHHARCAPWHGGKFKTMALREDGSVKFNDVSPHGSWQRGFNEDLVVNWHFNADADNLKNHRYHKLPFTDAWRLVHREGCSIHDDTLLIPMRLGLDPEVLRVHWSTLLRFQELERWISVQRSTDGPTLRACALVNAATPSISSVEIQFR